MKRARFYDNGGNTADRYTIVFLQPQTIAGRLVYFGAHSSSNPFHPQGVGCQWEHNSLADLNGGEHLGKRISLSKLPEKVQQYYRQLCI